MNYDNLAVVRGTWYPAVLCEGAFIMLPDQEAALRTPEFQERYARGIADGLEELLPHAAHALMSMRRARAPRAGSSWPLARQRSRARSPRRITTSARSPRRTSASTWPRGLEREGRVAAAAAERAYAQLARELARPRGRIDLVVSDDADYSNGFAIVSRRNRIVVFADAAGGAIAGCGSTRTGSSSSSPTSSRTSSISIARAASGASRSTCSAARRRSFPNATGRRGSPRGSPSTTSRGSRAADGCNDAEHRMIARAARDASEAVPRSTSSSLGTSRFPGGEGAYAYGSLFVDYLARTHGDAHPPLRRGAERAAHAVHWLDRAATRRRSASRSPAPTARGATPSLRSVGGQRAPPLPGWRELTTHGYYATSPRWLNDSTLVYTGTDGRETNAAYRAHDRPARARGSAGATRAARTSPLPDGEPALRAARLHRTRSAPLRSVRASRDGHVARLTHGARLIQPDARRDGAIVAVQLAAARSSLVLLDPGRHRSLRVLRAAGPDETWSEPRWSPDGRRIAVVAPSARRHCSRIEVIAPGRSALRGSRALERDRSRRRAGRPMAQRILYTTRGERLAAARRARSAGWRDSCAMRAASPVLDAGAVAERPAARRDHAARRRLSRRRRAVGDRRAAGAARSAHRHRRDRSPPTPRRSHAGDYYVVLARGARSLPALLVSRHRVGAASGTRLGVHHEWQRRRRIAGCTRRYAAHPDHRPLRRRRRSRYRYAGLRRPYVDVVAVAGLDVDSASVARRERRRRRHAAQAHARRVARATFVRPRVRARILGLRRGRRSEWRGFVTEPEPLLAQLDTTFQRGYTFPRALRRRGVDQRAAPGAQHLAGGRRRRSASPLRERWRTDAPSSDRVDERRRHRGGLQVARPARLRAPRARAAPRRRRRRLARRHRARGRRHERHTVDVVPGYTVGEGRRTFGVRGFPAASVYGTQRRGRVARVPRAAHDGHARLRLLPFFFDHSSLTAFADAGVATCARTSALSSASARHRAVIGRTIASAGAELGSRRRAVLEWDLAAAVPHRLARARRRARRHGAKAVSAYLAFGLSYCCNIRLDPSRSATSACAASRAVTVRQSQALTRNHCTHPSCLDATSTPPPSSTPAHTSSATSRSARA